MRRGYADLPLHGGHVPPWLLARMRRMARLVAVLVVDEYGPRGLLERLADPLWFQALNNIIGMDWDSSGSTTVTTAVLREALAAERLGVYAAGGKGERSRRAPAEIRAAAVEAGLPAGQLVEASRLAAKADNTALQDGYQLYHHAFFFEEGGAWAVVQQGMNARRGMARRYHWFYGEPRFPELQHHSGIAGLPEPLVLNTLDREAERHRRMLVDLASEKPSALEAELRGLEAIAKGYRPLVYYTPYTPDEARVLLERYRRLGPLRLNREALRAARERGVGCFAELLSTPGLGPSTLRALALVAELVYETPPSWRDPVTHPRDPFRYAYAVGGKDGVPFPVSREFYDEVLALLERLAEKTRDRRVLRLLAEASKRWEPPPWGKRPT